MKFLAIEKELQEVDWQNESNTLKEEAKHVLQLYLKGHIREIYFTASKNAVLILEGESKEQITEVLDTLPIVKKGWVEFEIMELQPYTGFERLIE